MGHPSLYIVKPNQPSKIRMITLQEILNSRSTLLKGKRIKLVHHMDHREQYRDIFKGKNRKKQLEYQREQGKPRFSDCDYIISFFGMERRRSLFFGVFKVTGCKIGKNKKYYYELEQIEDFDDLIDRLIIDWGKGALAWVQRDRPKEVLEILPAGYIGSFPGLLDFVLEFDDLRKLINNPDANHDWKHHLSAVNGVYLILDSSTGKQYVGSAYGDKGIWGRWSSYAATSHGGNRELEKLIKADPTYCRHFRFSVLQTLPSNFSARESVEVENLYKQKLGSRVHGLNL